MKTCRYCGIQQSDDSFEICRVVGNRVYRRHRCKSCKRKQKNVRRQAIRKWLDEYKKALVCSRCGFDDYRALVFHHSGDSEKDFNVSDMLSAGLSKMTIVKEIEKCEVLCSNCHLIEHYKD
jgi:hypothetical protein